MRVVIVFILALCFLQLSSALQAGAEVFMTRDEALKSVYPGAETIEKQRVYLSAELKKEVEAKAKSKLTSSVHTFYVAKKNGHVLGYSILRTDTVRTHTETLLITINPDGKLRQIDILAFYEPSEYMASERWKHLFSGKTLSSSLRVGRDIPKMTGATLTSHAVTKAVRISLALFEITCSNGLCKGV